MLPEKFTRDLIDSVNWSRRQLDVFLAKYMDILRQYVGHHYSRNGARARVPQNFIRMMASIYSRHLASRTPRCLVESKDPALRPMAQAAMEWANPLFASMGLEPVLQMWNLQAILYPVGMLKVCNGYGPDGDLAPPFVDNIDPERAVWDMCATAWTNIDFVGHRYTISKDELLGMAMQSPQQWNVKGIQKLQAEQHQQVNEIGGEKSETLQQDGSFQMNRLREYLDIWELYLPKENICVHFPVVGNMIDQRPVGIVPYVGLRSRAHPTGPFHLLGFDKVPGNLMPSPPVHHIYDLHEAINIATRKLLRQLKDQKTVLLVQSTFDKEGRAVTKANDGEALPVTDVKAFQELRMRGPDQASAAYADVLKNRIAYMGGNFDALGGLGVQSGTLGQDELLNAGSSRLMQFMQQTSQSATGLLMRAIVWQHWNSQRDLSYQLQVPGMAGMSLPWNIRGPNAPDRTPRGTPTFKRTPQMLDEMTLSVHPYSMQPVSPQQRAAQWRQIFLEYIVPMSPALEKMGYVVDIPTFVKKMADYADLPDIDEVLKMVPQERPDDGSEQPAQPQQSPQMDRPNGQYTRTSVTKPGSEDQSAIAAMDVGDAA